MKTRIIIDVDVSPTMAATIQRNGFSLCPNGSSLQVRVENSPPVPARKTKVHFIEKPAISFNEVVEASTPAVSI